MRMFNSLRWPAMFVALAAIGMAASFAAAPAASADLQQVTYECEWQSGPRLPAKVQLAAGAMDYNENVFYIFGGQNEANDVQNSLVSVDFSTAAQPSQATTQRLTAGSIERVAASGFYRPSQVEGEKGSVYFLFGSKDLGYPAAAGGSGNREGNGEDDVIQYNIETGQWRSVSVGGVALRERLLAAVAYDRENDVAIVTGGIKKCAVEDFLPANLGGNGQSCRPTQFPTLILSFDASGDITAAAGPAGGPSNIIGHTMDYDPTNKRILVHGGSTDGEKATSSTWVLDTTTLATAAWARGASGGPALGLHASAYNPDLNWLMVHGGGVSNLLLPNETVNNDTYGLDMPAMGAASWTDLDAQTTPADRVNHVGGFVSNGQMSAFVVASGRRKNSRDGSATISQSTDVLTCMEAAAPPTATMAPPTNTPGGPATATPARPVPPTLIPPTAGITVCTSVEGKVPAAAQNAASGNPQGVAGFNTPCNPNIASNPITNPLRRSLGLRNPNLPFHPIYNNLVLKCGCP